jgi:hypothetical protein
MIFVMMMSLLQPEMPSLYRNLNFIDGKCKKEGIVVVYGGIGRANEHTIEDINAVDSRLLSGSNTAIAFNFENHEYYIPVDDRIDTDYYKHGDTVCIDIVFLSQKDRNGIRYLSYVTAIRRK